MEMTEIEITYENLFKLIEQEENTNYEFEKEYFQSTPIEIIDENMAIMIHCTAPSFFIIK